MSDQPKHPRGHRGPNAEQRRIAELLERRQRVATRRFERDVKRPSAQGFRHRSR